VICLDVLRALPKELGTLEALVSEIWIAQRADSRWIAVISEIEGSLAKHARQIREGVRLESEREARKAAIGLQASPWLRYGSPAIAGAFCAIRVYKVEASAWNAAESRGCSANSGAGQSKSGHLNMREAQRPWAKGRVNTCLRRPPN
jgi:hypothetical protein